MNPKEQIVNREELAPDLSKEKENQAIFVVRFGVGPHSVRHSDSPVQLGQDLNLFFQPSDSPQRNIFYMEDAIGSQSFISKAREAYRVYGSWSRAYFWADLSSIWKKLDLVGEERFPSEDKLDQIVNVHIASLSGRYAENYKFLKMTLTSLDEIIKRKNIGIDLEIETRKNAQERSSVLNTIRLIDEDPDIISSDQMRDHIMRMWNLRRLRDSKVVDDLLELYKKTYRQKTPTKVYVSLGEDHLGTRDLLAKKLGKRPSYDISLTRGSVYPQYENLESSDRNIRFNVIINKAFALLDSDTQISNDEWQRLFEEFSKPPK